MKLKLDDERMSEDFFEGTRILGIACTLKNYHFCWHIEKTMQVDFHTSADLQIGMEKNRRSYSFTVYEYIDPVTAVEHFYTAISTMVNFCFRNSNTLISSG